MRCDVTHNDLNYKVSNLFKFDGFDSVALVDTSEEQLI